MEEKEVSLTIQVPKQVSKKSMYKNSIYRETDKMSDLICENYPMVLVMSRFGIALGFGEKNIGEVCRQNGVDVCTFLTVVNFLIENKNEPITDVNKCLSIESLILYLHNAHDYFLNFRLPHIRRKLDDAIVDCPKDVAFVIRQFFDEYTEEVNKHMSYEEKNVFPYVRALLKGEKDPKYNITIFKKRHDQIEMKISELKNILIKYYPGKDSYLLNSVLFDIFSTEQDLASHNHVEDYLFVPAILALEKQLNR
ncbi:hemerythrin domain-containing protein [Bacteroides sp. AM07-16]|nr:hemerythrin domain-containing protein [Bacteroides sp. AM07-16]